MLVALTREVSESFADCQLTHIARQPIDLRLAKLQHRHYEEALAVAGCTIRRLPMLPDRPDAVFVEDTAVVLDEMAVIARPGAPSRRLETSSVANALESYRSIEYIEPPGTLDGGDVLRIGRTLFVGLSTRTNQLGAEMLEELVHPHGFAVRRVTTSDCLHLKSAVTSVDETTVLLNPEWVDRTAFRDQEVIHVHPDEAGAANVLRIGDVLICASGFPNTQTLLEDRGCHVIAIDLSEIVKAEGAVTCCSIVLDVARSAAVAA